MTLEQARLNRKIRIELQKPNPDPGVLQKLYEEARSSLKEDDHRAVEEINRLANEENK